VNKRTTIKKSEKWTRKSIKGKCDTLLRKFKRQRAEKEDSIATQDEEIETQDNQDNQDNQEEMESEDIEMEKPGEDEDETDEDETNRKTC